MWEGLRPTLPEMQLRIPSSSRNATPRKWTVSPPGGESYGSRSEKDEQDWYVSLTADTVAVAHGGTARALMVALGHRNADQRRRPDSIEQAAVYVFRDGALQKYS